jgi:hypothetical protein
MTEEKTYYTIGEYQENTPSFWLHDKQYKDWFIIDSYSITNSSISSEWNFLYLQKQLGEENTNKIKLDNHTFVLLLNPDKKELLDKVKELELNKGDYYVYDEIAYQSWAQIKIEEYIFNNIIEDDEWSDLYDNVYDYVYDLLMV